VVSDPNINPLTMTQSTDEFNSMITIDECKIYTLTTDNHVPEFGGQQEIK